jgi:hypothetical protein
MLAVPAHARYAMSAGTSVLGPTTHCSGQPRCGQRVNVRNVPRVMQHVADDGDGEVAYWSFLKYMPDVSVSKPLRRCATDRHRR